jgi:hypothetical protein
MTNGEYITMCRDERHLFKWTSNLSGLATPDKTPCLCGKYTWDEYYRTTDNKNNQLDTSYKAEPSNE